MTKKNTTTQRFPRVTLTSSHQHNEWIRAWQESGDLKAREKALKAVEPMVIGFAHRASLKYGPVITPGCLSGLTPDDMIGDLWLFTIRTCDLFKVNGPATWSSYCYTRLEYCWRRFAFNANRVVHIPAYISEIKSNAHIPLNGVSRSLDAPRSVDEDTTPLDRVYGTRDAGYAETDTADFLRDVCDRAQLSEKESQVVPFLTGDATLIEIAGLIKCSKQNVFAISRRVRRKLYIARLKAGRTRDEMYTVTDEVPTYPP